MDYRSCHFKANIIPIILSWEPENTHRFLYDGANNKRKMESFFTMTSLGMSQQSRSNKTFMTGCSQVARSYRCLEFKTRCEGHTVHLLAKTSAKHRRSIANVPNIHKIPTSSTPQFGSPRDFDPYVQMSLSGGYLLLFSSVSHMTLLIIFTWRSIIIRLNSWLGRI